MHLITGNFLVAIQDQPIADLSAHTLVPVPILCDIRLLGRPRRTIKERFEGTNPKSCRRLCFWILLEVTAVLPTSQLHKPNALEAPAAWEASQTSRQDLKVRSSEIRRHFRLEARVK